MSKSGFLQPFVATASVFSLCAAPLSASEPIPSRVIVQYSEGSVVRTIGGYDPTQGCHNTDVFQLGRITKVSFIAEVPFEQIREDSPMLRQIVKDAPDTARSWCAKWRERGVDIGQIFIELFPNDLAAPKKLRGGAGTLRIERVSPTGQPVLHGGTLRVTSASFSEEIKLASGDRQRFEAILSAGGAFDYKRKVAAERVKALPPIPTQSLCTKTVAPVALRTDAGAVPFLQPKDACKLRERLLEFSSEFDCWTEQKCNASDPKTQAVIRELVIPSYITLMKNFEYYMSITPSDQLEGNDWLQGAYNDFLTRLKLEGEINPYKSDFSISSDPTIAKRPKIYQDFYRAIWLYRTGVADAYLRKRIPRLFEKKSKSYQAAMSKRWQIYNGLSSDDEKSAYTDLNHDQPDGLVSALSWNPRLTAQQLFDGYDGKRSLGSLVSSTAYERTRKQYNESYRIAHQHDAFAPIAALALGVILMNLTGNMPQPNSNTNNNYGFGLRAGQEKATAFGHTWDDLYIGAATGNWWGM